MKAFLAVLLASAITFAQDHQHTPAPPEPRVELETLRAPQRIEGIGKSHIPITTKSPATQDWFDQGLALFYCFWDYEALRAFEQAQRSDPNCAMCHWGLALALDFGAHTKQADEEIAKAAALSAGISDREQRYIRAYAARADQKKFASEMEALVERYPDDVEARLLLAVNTLGTPRSQALLEELLRDHPDNLAANHFWIHGFENSNPERALESAKRLAAMGLGSGHVAHMPGHIFFRMGDYDLARKSFENALRLDRDYMERQRVDISRNWNFPHNVTFLVVASAEAGRYREAREYSKLVDGLTNEALQPASSLARLAIRFADWDTVIKQPMRFKDPDAKLASWIPAYRDGVLAYARGMKAAESNQFAEADRQAAFLGALMGRLPQGDIVVTILGTALLELRGETAGYRGDFDTARRLLEQAVEKEKTIGFGDPPRYSRPPSELLGHILIRAGKFDDAREAFREALIERPKSGFPLYGIALSWEKQGNREQTVRAYQQFLAAWPGADPDLPQMKTAQSYLSKAQ